MQYDPVKPVFISALCTLEDVGMVILLISKDQVTCFWLLWLMECACPGKESSVWPQWPCTLTTGCSLRVLSLAALQSPAQVHMSYIYTSTIMVIFISQLLPESWTQAPAPGWPFLPYGRHSWEQVWRSGKMSWKDCFFHMHSWSSCNSNILKKFSLSKCIFTHICISELCCCQITLHFALYQMLILAVDIWARQEQEGSEESEKTKMTCGCISWISKLGFRSTESLAAQFPSQNWSGGCLSRFQDGSPFCPTGTNHTWSMRSAVLWAQVCSLTLCTSFHESTHRENASFESSYFVLRGCKEACSSCSQRTLKALHFWER